MEHHGTVVLDTERLLLRRFQKEDASAMFSNWASDPAVTRYLTWPTHPDMDVTRTVLEDWMSQYEDPGFYQWAIVLKEDPARPIGSISVVEPIDDKIQKAHIGYCIGQPWWHQGITSEALKKVIDFLFQNVGVNKVESRHDPANPHSGGVMKKAGLKYEGTLCQADWNNQGICDCCYYGLLKTEWEALHELNLEQ